MKIDVHHAPDRYIKVIGIEVYVISEDGTNDVISFKMEPIYMRSGSKITLEMA